MSPFIAELLGTMVMILLGDGVVANIVLKKTKGYQAGWITITTAWALAVFTGVVIAGPYSGAHLNPAITIGFAIAEKFPWASVGPYIIAQMLGATLGAFLVWIIYYDHFKATEDSGVKLGVFCTAPEIREFRMRTDCHVRTHVLRLLYYRGRTHVRRGLNHPDRPRFHRSHSRIIYCLGHRSFFRGSHRLCHQSRPGSRPENHARHPAHSGQRQ